MAVRSQNGARTKRGAQIVLSHIEHIYLEVINDFGYLIIAGQFFVGFLFSDSKKERNSLLALVFIFTFCGITRFLKFVIDIDGAVLDVFMILMPLATYAFIVSNKPSKIINGMRDTDE